MVQGRSVASKIAVFFKTGLLVTTIFFIYFIFMYGCIVGCYNNVTILKCKNDVYYYSNVISSLGRLFYNNLRKQTIH